MEIKIVRYFPRKLELVPNITRVIVARPRLQASEEIKSLKPGFGVFIVNSENISHPFLVLLLLNK